MTFNYEIAVAGCGYWGANLVRVFNQLGVLSLVCDPAEENLYRASQIAPGTKTTSSFSDALASSADGIVIAAPAVLHYSLAKQALEAGKDVFVEKPLALTYANGRELVTLASGLGRILMVGHVLEYHPGLTALQTLARSGVLGDVRYLSSTRVSLGKVRNEENVLWSFAPHDIALILRMFKARPTRIAASGGNFLRPNIADLVQISLDFPNGALAHIFVSWLNPTKEQRQVVVGSQKMAVYDDVTKELILHHKQINFDGDQPAPIYGKGEIISFPAGEPLLKECEAFLAAIADRKPPITDGASGLRVLEVLEAAQASLDGGGAPVSLP